MKPLLIAAIISLSTMSAWAEAAQAASADAAPVASLNNALTATMKAGAANESFAQREAALTPVVDQSFDLAVITQNSVGFLWNTLPATQQQQLSALMEQFTVASYVSQFNNFNGEQIKLLPAEKALGAKRIVQTQIVPADGSAPTEIDYVVGQAGTGWQISDVLLNGTISQVAIHSSDFSSLVSAGDASQLIAALKSKIAALANGSTSSAGQ
jgi:phospholipid transport system substrate-binding protein